MGGNGTAQRSSRPESVGCPPNGSIYDDEDEAAETLSEIERLTREVNRLRAALLAHCPNCCDIRWHHGQLR